MEIPQRAEHLRSTFSALLEMGVIPVVNENDSVSSAEIETGRHKVLGDNDTLSAIVARLCGADLLVLLSDIDGLYDADPHTHPDATLIHRVRSLTPEILEMAGGRRQLVGHRRHGHQAPPPPGSPWTPDATWSSPTAAGPRTSTALRRAGTSAPGSWQRGKLPFAFFPFESGFIIPGCLRHSGKEAFS